MTVPVPKTYSTNHYFKSRLTTAINDVALGRHAFCLRKSHAGNTPVFDLSVENFRPCSIVIAKLNGREEVEEIWNEEIRKIRK